MSYRSERSNLEVNELSSGEFNDLVVVTSSEGVLGKAVMGVLEGSSIQQVATNEDTANTVHI